MELLQSIWEFIQPYLTTANLMTAVIYILGGVVAKTGLDFIDEIKDIAETYRAAKKKSSPGGREITDAEMNKIRAEAAEAVIAVWDKYKGTILGFLGRFFGRIAFWK